MTTPQDTDTRAMSALARLLDDVMNGGKEPGEDRHVFALIVFTPGVIGGSHANWVSNGQRADMLAAMKEMVARFEAQDALAERKGSLQ